MSERYDTGMRTRREVLGEDHVNAATAAVTPLDADFQRWITESVWGDLWSNERLDRRTRSLVTIAILAALGSPELELHLKASLDTGVGTEELAETLRHVAIYAGVPAANSAFAKAKVIRGDAP